MELKFFEAIAVLLSSSPSYPTTQVEVSVTVLKICFHKSVSTTSGGPASVLWIERWEAWKTSSGAPYDREEEDYSKVEFDWDGQKATNPRWLYVTRSFVEAAKSVLN